MISSYRKINQMEDHVQINNIDGAERGGGGDGGGGGGGDYKTLNYGLNNSIADFSRGSNDFICTYYIN